MLCEAPFIDRVARAIVRYCFEDDIEEAIEELVSRDVWGRKDWVTQRVRDGWADLTGVLKGPVLDNPHLETVLADLVTFSEEELLDAVWRAWVTAGEPLHDAIRWKFLHGDPCHRGELRDVLRLLGGGEI